MKLKYMTDQQLTELYVECCDFVQMAQTLENYAQKEDNVDLAEQCRKQVTKHRNRADELYLEIRKRHAV